MAGCGYSLSTSSTAVAESVSGTPGVIATLELLHRPTDDASPSWSYGSTPLRWRTRCKLVWVPRAPAAATLDLDTGAGRGWAASLRHVLDAAVPGGLLANPVIAELRRSESAQCTGRRPDRR
jgi:hypothetical protein